MKTRKQLEEEMRFGNLLAIIFAIAFVAMLITSILLGEEKINIRECQEQGGTIEFKPIANICHLPQYKTYVKSCELITSKHWDFSDCTELPMECDGNYCYPVARFECEENPWKTETYQNCSLIPVEEFEIECVKTTFGCDKEMSDCEVDCHVYNISIKSCLNACWKRNCNVCIKGSAQVTLVRKRQ